MAATKLIVIYPTPKDVDAFERAYSAQHLPMAAPVFAASGATKAVLTRVAGAPAGAAPYHRMAEIHFPSHEMLTACVTSQAGREVLADARNISNGGAPIVLIGTEEVVTLTR
jgi:uncharacterized protein (TIGR02118 family)